ncbi:hypothetical protein C8Q73DRAFT_147980 [Cubamyces lactineus]|nr:hypothetical protein C8Q73DRAFT_147980 [Cubamyces lactineus]
MANTRLPCFQASRRFLLLRLNLSSLRPCADLPFPMTCPLMSDLASMCLWTASVDRSSELRTWVSSTTLWSSWTLLISDGNRLRTAHCPLECSRLHKRYLEDYLETLLGDARPRLWLVAHLSVLRRPVAIPTLFAGLFLLGFSVTSYVREGHYGILHLCLSAPNCTQRRPCPELAHSGRPMSRVHVVASFAVTYTFRPRYNETLRGSQPKSRNMGH